VRLTGSKKTNKLEAPSKSRFSFYAKSSKGF